MSNLPTEPDFPDQTPGQSGQIAALRDEHARVEEQALPGFESFDGTEEEWERWGNHLSVAQEQVEKKLRYGDADMSLAEEALGDAVMHILCRRDRIRAMTDESWCECGTEWCRHRASALYSYVKTAARRGLQHQAERQARRGEACTIEDLGEGEHHAYSPESGPVQGVLGETFSMAFRFAGETGRQCLVLRFVFDFTNKEIAAHFGETETAVSNRLGRIYILVREALGRAS